MDTAIDFAVGFHAVPDDPAIAVWADRRQCVDRTFEAIECVMLSGYHNFERLVIFIFANFACSHIQLFRSSAALRWCPPGIEKVENSEESDTFLQRRVWKYQSN
jgi:hypothetical protein